MEPVSHLIRRSTLIIPVSDRDAIEGAWRHGADAVVIDLVVPADSRTKAANRAALAPLIEAAGQAAADVLVRVNPTLLDADISAAVTHSVAGIVLPGARTAEDVRTADVLLEARERAIGLEVGSLEILLHLDTVEGAWNIRGLIAASERVRSTALDDVALIVDLGTMPSEEFDALRFLRGRLIVETLAQTRLPLGLEHPLGVRPRRIEAADLERVLVTSRDTGLKGSLVRDPAWVDVCNRVYTPSEEQLEYYRDVRRRFAEGVARGTATVPGGNGRMIDVPVDERARKVIDLWERCTERDRRKAAALARAQSGSVHSPS